MATSVTDDNVYRAYVFIRSDRCIKVTDIARELDISPGSAHSIVHYKVDY
jgi:Mn-dependent DtxR family transcriptional regulator